MTTRHSTSIDTVESRSVDPGHLDGLGKQAARLAETSDCTLNEAVVHTIGHEKLNSEQVRRVVEIANVEAFHRKYASLDPQSRVVHLDGGPADVAQVLQSLNGAARPREQMIESLDYDMAPEAKVSSIDFAPTTDRTVAGVIGDVLRLQSKLAAAHEEVVTSAEASEFAMNEALLQLADTAKWAGLQGAAPQEVFEAWHRVNPELAKIAFARLSRFIPASNEKVASRSINPDHAVVRDFERFAKHAQEYGTQIAARQRVEAEVLRVNQWLDQHGG